MTISRRLLQISCRNVLRNKRRTLLTLLILILGSTGLILVGGFFEGIHDSFREQYIHSQSGHLQVDKKGYYDEGVAAPFDYLIKNTAQIQKILEAQPHVQYTVPHLKFGGMAGTDKTNVAVLALGVDADREKVMSVSKYSQNKKASAMILQGQDLDTNDPSGVVIGKGLMEALGLQIGDSFNLITTRQAGAIDGAEYRIRGTFQTILKEFDDRGMKMNLAAAQKLLGLNDEVHSLLVMLDDTKRTSEVQNQLVKLFQDQNLKLESITWEDQGLFYRHGKGLLDKIYATVQLIIAVVFFFSIANTINMAVFERMREFGTMMATGNGRGTIFMVIFMEAAVLGLLGSFLGIAFGTGLAKIISSIGIVMPPLPGSSSSYIATIIVPPWIMLRVFILGFFSTLLAAALPGYRASHLQIIHALGYV